MGPATGFKGRAGEAAVGCRSGAALRNDRDWRSSGMPSRLRRLPLLLLPVLAALAGPNAQAADPAWAGWSRFEVIRLDEGATGVQLATVAGHPTAVVVNRRQSRLDLIRLDRSATAAPPATALDSSALNRIPMPPDFSHERIPCPAPPLDVVVVGGDLVVITGTPWRATRYRRGAGGWQAVAARELPDIEPEKRMGVLALPDALRTRLLIPTTSGVQVLGIPVGEGIDQPDWLRPRTRTRGVSWDVVDLDRDGDLDVVEAYPSTGGGLRWQENQGGVLTPPQPLLDDPVKSMAAIDGPYPLAIVNRNQQDSVDLARLELGIAGPLATGWTIPVPAQGVAVGASIAGQAVLAVAAPGEARIELHRIRPGQWADGGSFPAPKGMKGLISPLADTILIWAADQADLLATRWQDGRLSFPAPWRPAGVTATGDRLVVGLDSAAGIDWWFQRQDDDLCLWTWPATAAGPALTRFVKAGGKITQAQWLGGDRVVVRTGFQADAELLIAQGDKPALRRTSAALPGLAKLEPAKLRLVAWGGALRPARIVDAVWQWLDPELTPTDQVQLPDDEIADLATINGRTWALTAKGKGAWRMEAGAGGLLHPTDRVRSVVGDRLRVDRWLGVLAVGTDQVRVLADGAPRTLVVKAQADLRALVPTGAIQASRLAVAPVRGTALDLLIHDDPARRLALFASDGTAIAAWPVWEDRRYPYSGDDEGRKSAVAEPRAVAGGDLDRDGKPDLVLLSQDRILFYLSAREARP